MSKYESFVDFKYEPYVFRLDPNMCKKSPMMTKYMSNRPMKGKKDLKEIETNDTVS